MTASVNRYDVTIGLVSLNEERTIGKSLKALVDQLDGLSGEIIVVAGGNDRTLEIVKTALDSLENAHVLEDLQPRGKPAALNRLFDLARGEILILSDGDVLVRGGSVKNLLSCFSSDDVGAASGRVVGSGPKEGYNYVQKACDLMTEMIHRSRASMFSAMGTIDLASGYLIAVRRDLLERVPEDSNSDDGFTSLIVRKKGRKIAYMPDSIVEINYPRTFSDFLNQKTRTRIGHMQLKRLFPDSDARTMRREVGEFFGFGKARKSLGYGPSVTIVAALLTGIAWLRANLRGRFGLPRKKAWIPVPSTK